MPEIQNYVLLGQKVVLNEFVAFSSFADIKSQLKEHSAIMMTFVLRGFANDTTDFHLPGGSHRDVPDRLPARCGGSR